MMQRVCKGNSQEISLTHDAAISRVTIWLIFAIMAFVAEPLALHKRMATSHRPAQGFAGMARMHQVLLALAAITMVGAVGGRHGLF